jgi:SAM-dependent methyltransferase
MTSATKSIGVIQSATAILLRSRVLRKYLGRAYLRANIWVWNRLPDFVTQSRLGVGYGAHLHSLIQMRPRKQSVGTFFFRNRPELELLIRLLEQTRRGSTLDVAVVACSKGAEVYSISYSIRCARPDLEVHLHAVDIEREVLDFAEAGVYSLGSHAVSSVHAAGSVGSGPASAWLTSRDQPSPIFERICSGEMNAMFELEGREVTVKAPFRDGITWHLEDARDPKLVDVLGSQDIVVANRFLCHMPPEDAEACLRNVVRLVKPGGYLFVSGVDLNVRCNVARELGWRPVTDLIREIHDGDPSLRRDWPFAYWGLEPFNRARIDWKMRYASVFQIVTPSAPPTRNAEVQLLSETK